MKLIDANQKNIFLNNLQLAKSDDASGLRAVIQKLVNTPFAPTHNIVQKEDQSLLKLE